MRPVGPPPPTDNVDAFFLILLSSIIGIMILAMLGSVIIVAVKLVIGFFQWRKTSAKANENYRIWANVVFSFQKESPQPTIKFQTYSHKLFEMVEAPNFWKLYVKYNFERRYRQPFLIEIEGKIV
jgi:hypothetical protein